MPVSPQNESLIKAYMTLNKSYKKLLTTTTTAAAAAKEAAEADEADEAKAAKAAAAEAAAAEAAAAGEAAAAEAAAAGEAAAAAGEAAAAAGEAAAAAGEAEAAAVVEEKEEKEKEKENEEEAVSDFPVMKAVNAVKDFAAKVIKLANTDLSSKEAWGSEAGEAGEAATAAATAAAAIEGLKSSAPTPTPPPSSSSSSSTPQAPASASASPQAVGGDGGGGGGGVVSMGGPASLNFEKLKAPFDIKAFFKMGVGSTDSKSTLGHDLKSSEISSHEFLEVKRDGLENKVDKITATFSHNQRSSLESKISIKPDELKLDVKLTFIHNPTVDDKKNLLIKNTKAVINGMIKALGPEQQKEQIIDLLKHFKETCKCDVFSEADSGFNTEVENKVKAHIGEEIERLAQPSPAQLSPDQPSPATA